MEEPIVQVVPRQVCHHGVIPQEETLPKLPPGAKAINQFWSKVVHRFEEQEKKQVATTHSKNVLLCRFLWCAPL